MASLLKHMPSSALAARPHHAYLARGTRPEARARVAATATGVYVGNLAFVTSDAALHALFSRCGAVDRVIMGLNAQTRLPCGFAFVLFFTRKAALDAVRFLHGTVLDERLIKGALWCSFLTCARRAESGYPHSLRFPILPRSRARQGLLRRPAVRPRAVGGPGAR